MTLRQTLAAAIALPAALLVSTTAWAGPKEDMMAVSKKFLALRSYHVTMINSDKRVPASEVDFVAPDRYRLQMQPMGTQYIIGDTMYMSIDGRSMRIPMPKGTMTQWREPTRAFREVDKLQVEALGSEAVNGQPAKKYRFVQTGTPATSTLVWIGSNGYPIKMETSSGSGKRANTMTVFYSRFNDPAIKIDIPK
jgi:outer membrane lipoprotein-sorting protein